MRYAIKNAKGNFYTECEILGTREMIEKDASGARTVYDRHVLKPKFDANHFAQASKYDTEADAMTLFTHPQLDDPKDFDGCKVVPVPDFNQMQE